MGFQAVRGATQVDVDEREHVLEATTELLQAVLKANELDHDDVISVLFTATPDLHSVVPGVRRPAARASPTSRCCAPGDGVAGSMPRVVRLLAHVDTDLTRAEIRTSTCGGGALRPTARSTPARASPRTVAATLGTVRVVGTGLLGTASPSACAAAAVRCCCRTVADRAAGRRDLGAGRGRHGASPTTWSWWPPRRTSPSAWWRPSWSAALGHGDRRRQREVRHRGRPGRPRGGPDPLCRRAPDGRPGAVPARSPPVPTCSWAGPGWSARAGDPGAAAGGRPPAGSTAPRRQPGDDGRGRARRRGGPGLARPAARGVAGRGPAARRPTDPAVALAGQGLRDVTRIAGSDPAAVGPDPGGQRRRRCRRC